MGGDRVDVSVLIPVLNEADHLRDTAEQMLAQDLDGPFELLFIDGGSEDDSRRILDELAAEHPGVVRVLDNPARRTPQALNIGLRAARGEFVARMDAHSHYPAAYLRLGVERLRTGGVVHVSGPMVPVGHDTWSCRVAAALHTPAGAGQAGYRDMRDEEWEVDTGFAGMWRRDLLLEAGGWDEGWPSDQDCELAGRLAARGGRFVCVPGMAAEYLPRNSLERLARQYHEYGLYKVKTLGRHPHMARSSHVAPPVLLAAAAVAVLPVPRALRLPAGAGLAAYLALLAAMAVRAVRAGARDEAPFVPAACAVMHFSYAAGMVRGARRWGVPWQAIGTALRRLAG